MDPGGLDLTSFELGALRLAPVWSAARQSCSCWTSHPAPPARRRDRTGATSSSRCSAETPDAGGTLWLTTVGGSAFDVLADGGASVTAAGYGPQPNDVVAARARVGHQRRGVAGGRHQRPWRAACRRWPDAPLDPLSRRPSSRRLTRSRGRALPYRRLAGGRSKADPAGVFRVSDRRARGAPMNRRAVGRPPASEVPWSSSPG